MHIYVERFRNSDDEFAYKKVEIAPVVIGAYYKASPVYQFELTQDDAEFFGLSGDFFDFDNHTFFIGGCREFPNETFTYNGESLYPPPLLLPDVFASIPAKS